MPEVTSVALRLLAGGVAGTVVITAAACLLMGFLLHFFAAEAARDLVASYVAALAPGSYVVLSAGRADAEAAKAGFGTYASARQSPAVTGSCTARSPSPPPALPAGGGEPNAPESGRPAPEALQGVSTILPMFWRCRIRRWAAAASVKG
jgi:hypothetical protein